MKAKHPLPVVAVEGIDGSGKSQTTHEAISQLSRSYPGRIIRVVDSQGVRTYAGSLVIDDRHEWLERIEHAQAFGKLGRIASLAVFTLGRRAMERRARQEDADLVITVRDSLRVDPAAYAPVLGPSALGRFNPEHRLRFLDRFTRVAPVDQIVHLRADIPRIVAGLALRETQDDHESAENLVKLDGSLSAVIEAHRQIYGTTVSEIEGLQAKTVDEVAATIEPHLGAALELAA